MHHGLNNDFLCSACKLSVSFTDDLGKTIQGGGTGFFIQDSLGVFCLLTNRHVVDIDYKRTTGEYKNFKISQVIIDVKYKDTQTGLPTVDDQLLILNINNFIYSNTFENDIACLKDPKVASLTGQEPRLDFWIPFEFLASKEKLDSELVICDFVAFPGFPDWYDKVNKLPILRTGTIASDPRFNYCFSGKFDGDCIAYEAFSYSGSSGSPVFATQKGIKVGSGLSGGGFRELMLIGINAGHLPIQGVYQSHSGISYLYKSYSIIDML